MINEYTEDELKIRERIACPEAGYPAGEAMFDSIYEWEDYHRMNWNDYVAYQQG